MPKHDVILHGCSPEIVFNPLQKPVSLGKCTKQYPLYTIVVIVRSDHNLRCVLAE